MRDKEGPGERDKEIEREREWGIGKRVRERRIRINHIFIFPLPSLTLSLTLAVYLFLSLCKHLLISLQTLYLALTHRIIDNTFHQSYFMVWMKNPPNPKSWFKPWFKSWFKCLLKSWSKNWFMDIWISRRITILFISKWNNRIFVYFSPGQ